MDIHLPNAQNLDFDDDEDLAVVVEEGSERQTKLLAFFDLNLERQQRRDVKDLFYTDLPNRYVWKKDRNCWDPRQRHKGTIARMYYINPSAGELFYLRYLLLNVPNPVSFENLRTMNDNIISTFHGVCTARDLLHNDVEWNQTLKKAGV